ncbi:hypothetical protein RhiirA4_479398 [Rhizophagus irregularis]|uniref:Uncharacterized protein n=1 Tax=Rhizophagus irregularis TaxID=588596 RepID=A0A2I1HGE0_9GLOM|nr:hypothetical protein RhiirA4_479398 [Rhizophagus irregularis]
MSTPRTHSRPHPMVTCLELGLKGNGLKDLELTWSLISPGRTFGCHLLNIPVMTSLKKLLDGNGFSGEDFLQMVLVETSVFSYLGDELDFDHWIILEWYISKLLTFFKMELFYKVILQGILTWKLWHIVHVVNGLEHLFQLGESLRYYHDIRNIRVYIIWISEMQQESGPNQEWVSELCNGKICEESVKNQDSEFSLIYHHSTSENCKNPGTKKFNNLFG